MAKRKKSHHRKQSSKCPEPFNSLIDLGGLLVFNHIMRKRINKGSGRRSYASGGVVRGRTGYKPSSVSRPMSATDRSFAYDDIETKLSKPLDNRYAWRLNCEDGREYAVNPENYETREAYDRALCRAKQTMNRDGEPIQKPNPAQSTVGEYTASDNNADERFLCCKVSCLDSGENIYCRTEQKTIKVGDMVTLVTADERQKQAIVLSVEHPGTAPTPILSEEITILCQTRDR
jgi:hypothetical protein